MTTFHFQHPKVVKASVLGNNETEGTNETGETFHKGKPLLCSFTNTHENSFGLL